MQADLLSAPVERQTMTDRVAAIFKSRPNEWIDARDVLHAGGFGGWRTRVSELRYPPYSMQIENRTRKVRGLTESHYRFVTEA